MHKFYMWAVRCFATAHSGVSEILSLQFKEELVERLGKATKYESKHVLMLLCIAEFPATNLLCKHKAYLGSYQFNRLRIWVISFSPYVTRLAINTRS